MTDLINRRPAGFDYDFRPASYFEDVDPKTIILSSISGEHRRRDVEARLASGDFNPLVWGEWLTDPTLDPDTRRLLSSVHPGLMSGEYLPPMGAQDIEIARVVLASVTGDVISVRARRGHGSAGGIAYLVVDEYETDYQLTQQHSARPLTLGELIALINTAGRDDDETAGGLAISHVVWHCEQGECEGMRGFVRVESAFYPELNRFFDTVLGEYLDGVEEAIR
ncbi:MAG: hypothetical protein FJY55_04125 [Betaproteobacteria bacterium]|nr:hypothetical protein [Betaproteobacteria bacterium]